MKSKMYILHNSFDEEKTELKLNSPIKRRIYSGRARSEYSKCLSSVGPGFSSENFPKTERSRFFRTRNTKYKHITTILKVAFMYLIINNAFF